MPPTARVGAVVMVLGFVDVLATRASSVGCLLGVALMLAGALAVAIASDRRERPGHRAPQRADEPPEREALRSTQGTVRRTKEKSPSADGKVGAPADGQVGASGDGQVGTSGDGQVGASADGQVDASADDQVGASADG